MHKATSLPAFIHMDLYYKKWLYRLFSMKLYNYNVHMSRLHTSLKNTSNTHNALVLI